MCGLTMTILWGKTAGSIFMAGCVDHIRKECNMTPKQWYEMGDSVIQVTRIISCHVIQIQLAYLAGVWCGSVEEGVQRGG